MQITAQQEATMTKKKKVIIGVSSGVAFLLVAILLGLILTGYFVGWGTV